MDVTLDTKRLIQDQNMTLNVKIYNLNQWRWRLWLGKHIIRLAAWVMWMDVVIGDGDIVELNDGTDDV